MAKLMLPTEEEFRDVFDRLQRAYNVDSDVHVILCAHHYQNVTTHPFIDLGYFEQNRLLRVTSIPGFVAREHQYFPKEAVAA